MKLLKRIEWPKVAVFAILVVLVVMLRRQGRVWFCECGQFLVWVSDSAGPHTSQHLLDPYAFTHVEHGLALFWLVWYVAPRWSWHWQCALALAIEAAWEVLENTQWVISHYRNNTAALGYTGDSVVNSLGDVLACWLGLVLAKRLGWNATWVLFLAIEVVLLITIRDSLLLNVLMFVAPIDALKSWQMG